MRQPPHRPLIPAARRRLGLLLRRLARSV